MSRLGTNDAPTGERRRHPKHPEIEAVRTADMAMPWMIYAGRLAPVGQQRFLTHEDVASWTVLQ